ncbi:hypothetical protein GXW71_33800 [Roseomonas hellenica]|uniref:Uncharacterized protein n=1 Tax=Plastoroseomonas hellenica TaxID=2687306 RepID=A0ABS5F9Y6_9PROT|nr:hypothetical protein [Plastoroseomonas hellenica]MBR0669373.1 hypothetical protein [Plastoroseomonas hellenica]
MTTRPRLHLSDLRPGSRYEDGYVDAQIEAHDWPSEAILAHLWGRMTQVRVPAADWSWGVVDGLTDLLMRRTQPARPAD